MPRQTHGPSGQLYKGCPLPGRSRSRTSFAGQKTLWLLMWFYICYGHLLRISGGRNPRRTTRTSFHLRVATAFHLRVALCKPHPRGGIPSSRSRVPNIPYASSVLRFIIDTFTGGLLVFQCTALSGINWPLLPLKAEIRLSSSVPNAHSGIGPTSPVRGFLKNVYKRTLATRRITRGNVSTGEFTRPHATKVHLRALS